MEASGDAHGIASRVLDSEMPDGKTAGTVALLVWLCRLKAVGLLDSPAPSPQAPSGRTGSRLLPKTTIGRSGQVIGGFCQGREDLVRITTLGFDELMARRFVAVILPAAELFDTGKGGNQPCGLDLPHGLNRFVNLGHAFAAGVCGRSS